MLVMAPNWVEEILVKLMGDSAPIFGETNNPENCEDDKPLSCVAESVESCAVDKPGKASPSTFTCVVVKACICKLVSALTCVELIAPSVDDEIAAIDLDAIA